MKIYYVANARIPSEKAHGIQIAKMCEAFIRAGADLTLVVPSRKGGGGSMQEFYGLTVPVPVRRLPVPDWYLLGRLGYRLSSYWFMAAYTLFLWTRQVQGEKFVLYTVDLDTFSSSALALVNAPLYTEMHGGKPNTFSQRQLFNNLRGVIAINPLISEELGAMFPRANTRYIVEPNGVDVEAFHPTDKLSARRTLGIAEDACIVLYAGRFFAWKGLEIMADAAVRTDGVLWYMVGGTKEEFLRVSDMKDTSPNIIFAGEQKHQLMPLWLAAADVLLVLGTSRDTQSYRYTSPMKLFEYLLSERPIIAANTPAIRTIVNEHEVVFYEPDAPESLAASIRRVFSGEVPVLELTHNARAKGERFSWSGRARRILAFMNA